MLSATAMIKVLINESKEFNVDVNADWRQKQSENQGLGTIYNYWKNAGYHQLGKGVQYDNKSYSFTQSTTNEKIHIDYISQGSEVSKAWSTFVIDNAKGFSRAGVERINDSIRTYCWAILGSQSQTRTDILGSGTAFDAQKQFLANVKDAINSPVDLPSQIARYQNTLKYARSKVDFVFGIGLYMSPSNMELRIGTIQDYNNEIIVATDAQGLGLNDNLNTKPVPPKQTQTVNGTKTKPKPVPSKQIQTVNKTKTKQSHQEPDYHAMAEKYAKEHNLSQNWIDNVGVSDVKIAYQLEHHKKDQHLMCQIHLVRTMKTKTALIVGSIVVGAAAIMLYKVT